MDDVTIRYSSYNDNPIARQIEFELIEDILLTLKLGDDAHSVIINMSDTITANTELEGTLSYDKLNVLIKTLSQLRNQIREYV